MNTYDSWDRIPSYAPDQPDKRDGIWWAMWIGVIFVAIALVWGVVSCASSYYGTDHRTNILVTDKDRVCSGTDKGTDCKYLIFTDHGTFRASDSLFAGRFNSSDAYGQIRRCHRYDFDTYGWRFGYTSSYPNIKKFTDLGRDENCEVE